MTKNQDAPAEGYLRGWDTTKMKWGAFNPESREFERYFESEEQARSAVRKVNREAGVA